MSKHILLNLNVEAYTSVDEVYGNMDEGQRQHMANKLNKHGYVNPKLTGSFPEGKNGTEILADELMDRCGGFKGAVLFLSRMIP